MKRILISTPKEAHAHLQRIRTEVEKAKTDKLMHEQKKAMTPPSLSLEDFMNSKMMPSKFSDREKLAKQFGFRDYHGTSQHNGRLLAILQAQHANPTPNTTE